MVAQITGRPLAPWLGPWNPILCPKHPCTGTARTSFPCVRLSRCLGNRLVAQQPVLQSPCLVPGGRSGQQWSAGSYASFHPLPVQAFGKGKEEVEEDGWGSLQKWSVSL